MRCPAALMRVAALTATMLVAMSTAYAQQGEDLRAAAQNPVGDLISVPFQNNTFTTVGYGDIVLGREWRRLGTFEAINGWVIFGWATALIIAVIQRLYFRSGKT